VLFHFAGLYLHCDALSLSLLCERLRALDVPELPEPSRAALHQFLQAAKQLLK
jgi:hypothetical protein